MEILHEIEITWLLLLQSLGEWLAGPMEAVSVLGIEEFYLLIMPALYWSLNSALGFRLGVLLLLTSGFNTAFKLAFHSPRPYWVDTRIHAYVAETSFGVPSGHAQHAASIWGLMATAATNKWAKWFFVLLIFLIGISRLFLGVHFVSDILVGWLIGGLLLWIFLKVEQPVWAWVRTKSLAQMLALALASSVALMMVILLSGALVSGWVLPEEWSQNALIAYEGNEIDPLSISGAFTNAGTWFGLLAGAAWFYHRRGGFQADGTPGQRVLRYWIGLVGVFALWYGLGAFFPRSADLLSYGLRFFRYMLVGLWITAGAPLLFQRFGLVQAQKKVVPSLSSQENLL